MPPATVLRSGLLIDGTGGAPVPGATVVIEDGNIVRVGRDRAVEVPKGARVFELDGRAVMPALSDAHVHLGIVHLSAGAAHREPLAVWAMKVRQVIEETLEMGFTTVRDAGAIDGGFAQAGAGGYIRGPRLPPRGPP